MGAHSVMASVRANIGVRVNRMGDAVDGRIGSLMNNLTPSAIGWRSP